MSNHRLNSIPRLPRPIVAQADGNVLILQPEGDFTVEVARWRSMTVGQPTTLHISGKNLDGSTRMLRVVDAEPLTQAETVAGWSRSIGWEQLQELEPGSHLTFVFQAALEESEYACPALFPPLSLEIRAPYEDRTTFSAQDGTDNWNGWMRGEAGADFRDLTVAKDGAGHSLFNHTSSEESFGVLLQKSFANLEVGRTYSFGLDVRRWMGWHAFPVLSLNCGTQVIVPETQISHSQVLEGSFTACSSQMELQVVSHVATGIGNDYIIREIWVKSP